MNWNRSIILAATAALAACSNDTATTEAVVIQYPQTETIDHSDDYHGTTVADPYRWLEDDVRESDAVKRWVDSENEITFDYLATIKEREPIRKRLEALWDYERYGLPEKKGGRYFYSYNDGLQNQNVIYRQESLQDEPELLIDPNTWSDDGTIALASYYPGPNGDLFAYLVQDGGSDWRVARVMDIHSGKVLDDKLEWLKFTGLSWAADGSGFYYSRSFRSALRPSSAHLEIARSA